MPVPMKKGQPVRANYQYEHNGTANLFMMFAPLEGWRHAKVTERQEFIHNNMSARCVERKHPTYARASTKHRARMTTAIDSCTRH